jgi:phosphoesterase RecJ-like protein
MACHINPDGDALGSMIALGVAIRLRYPDKVITMLSRDGVPDIYRFLPLVDQVQTHTDRRDFDLAVVLDSGDLKRVGHEIVPVIQSARVQMDIDHHIGEGSFGSVRLISSRSAATAEIVFDLVDFMGAPITPDIARCLLTGIITDTGSFRFMNVTPRTLRVAASLIEAGASPALIAERVFDNRGFESTHLMGVALASLEHTPDGKITWAAISRAAFEQTHTTDEDTEGLINFVRSVRGTRISLLFREVKPNVIRISLRCTQEFDVAAIAGRFGGGGHKLASGCSFHGPLAAAIEAIVSACGAAVAAVG